MQEMLVRSLGWEDTLEEEMATHSNILAWKTPWTEKPGGLQSTGLQSIRDNLVTKQQQHLVTLVPRDDSMTQGWPHSAPHNRRRRFSVDS